MLSSPLKPLEPNLTLEYIVSGLQVFDGVRLTQTPGMHLAQISALSVKI
jgi:hypothetical protein